MKEQEPCLYGGKPLVPHHRGGCRCQCTARERDVSAAVYKDEFTIASQNVQLHVVQPPRWPRQCH